MWAEDYSGLYEVTVANTDRTIYCSYTTLTLSLLHWLTRSKTYHMSVVLLGIEGVSCCFEGLFSIKNSSKLLVSGAGVTIQIS